MEETTTETEALVREYRQLWNEREYDRLAELVADDATIEDPIEGEARGPSGVETWLRETVSDFPDFRGEEVDMLVGDGTVMALMEFSMTPADAFEEGSPEEPGFTFEGMVRLHFADGKLREHRAFYDPQKLYDQLGDSMA